MDTCQEQSKNKIRSINGLVAEKCGVSVAYVRMIRNGHRAKKSKKSLLVVAELNRILNS